MVSSKSSDLNWVSLRSLLVILGPYRFYEHKHGNAPFCNPAPALIRQMGIALTMEDHVHFLVAQLLNTGG